MTTRQLAWSIIAVLMLLIPLAMLFTDDVQGNEAAGYVVILLVLGGAYETIMALKKRSGAYRLAFGVGIAGVFLLGWVSGAVGIIGSENNPANLMYWAVFAVCLIGSVISRFRPRGMARTLFAAALVQLSVPVIALFVWPAQTSWGAAGVRGVFILNFIFVILFAGSALLFRRAKAAG